MFNDDSLGGDASDERTLADLRRLMRAELPPPLGLEARLLAAARRRRPAPNGELRVVVTAVVFSAVAFGAGAAVALAALVFAAAYAWWVVAQLSGGANRS